MAKSSTKSYDIQKDKDRKISIKIAEAPCKAEGLVLATWSSSFLLSNVLHKLQVKVSPNPHQDGYDLIELGAGTGLTGLSAAAIWGLRSLLTDLPGIVPGLQENAVLNAETIRSYGGNISCGTLDWNNPDICHIHDDAETLKDLKVSQMGGFPIVIAADTMYTEDHPLLLSRTIASCLRRSSDARFIFCCPLRTAYIDHLRDFWQMMEDRGLIAVEEGRQEIDLKDWDDEKLHEWSVWKWKEL